jgi:hypothetical protein
MQEMVTEKDSTADGCVTGGKKIKGQRQPGNLKPGTWDLVCDTQKDGLCVWQAHEVLLRLSFEQGRDVEANKCFINH